MDNHEIDVPNTDAAKFAVLIVPPGVEKLRDFPFPVSESSEILDVIQTLLTAIRDEETIVIPVDGKHADIVIRVARAADIELRALQGFEGEYPSYWLASTNMLPQAVASEMILAGENSAGIGGTGVQDKKRDKSEMKAPDYDDAERRAGAFDEPEEGDAE